MNWLSFTKTKINRHNMKIFLTDDHVILLSGLIKILAMEEGIEVVGSATSLQETYDKLTRVTPDILVTDYNLPDGDGLALIRKVKRKYPSIKLIVLSQHDEAHLVQEVLKEGISGYLLKKDSHTELISAIKAATQGQVYLSSDINKLLIQGLHGLNDQKLLTDREREVLSLIAEEYTNKQIAEELFISERTVETHRKNIFRKTQTHNLVGLIKYAYANNLI